MSPGRAQALALSAALSAVPFAARPAASTVARCVAWCLAQCVAVAGVVLLTACTVGPDFQAPGTPEHAGFTEAPLPEQIPAAAPEPGGEAQTLHMGNDLAQDWWTLFRSEPLNRFIESALRDSPSVAAASAALRQAQEVLAANRGTLLLPGVDAKLSAARDRATGATIGFQTPSTTFNLYNAQVNVSYTLDLFGSVRRQLESTQALVDFQQYQLRGAQLALTANIVTAVVREAQLRDQIQALRDVEKIERAGLTIVEQRFALGAVTRTDVLAQRTALAATVAAIPPLERQRAQTRHLLAVYAGKTPAEVDLAALDLARLELPVDLPVSLPSALARQRPDVLEAEALLHQASAQVGVATANLYPQITLSADYGFLALGLGSLFKPSSVVWGLSAGLVQPIFHGAALAAQRQAAIAAFDEAAANYRQTVLLAFANVADTLAALQLDARALAADTDTYDQARASADMAQRQFDVGASSYLSLLAAQQQLSQAAVAVVQARADRFADTAALFQALGGGWWNAPERNTSQPAPSVKPVASN